MPLISAATVMIMNTGQRLPEFLLVLRSPELSFQGNVWVFPGGRVSKGDVAYEGKESALRKCAVRETKEESRIKLDPATLTRMARWETPEGMPRRFDTQFYLSRVTDRPAVQVDGREIINFQWVMADSALTAHQKGKIRLSPPAFVLLSWAASLKTADNLLAFFRTAPPIHFKPRYVPLPDGACTLYQDDVAYETGDLTIRGQLHRLLMLDSGWRYIGGPFDHSSDTASCSSPRDAPVI